MKHLLLTLNICIYSTFSFSQINANLLFQWDDPSLIGSSMYDNTYNECWGFKINDHEIAVIGSTAGTHFFDVTDPQNSTEVAFVPGKYIQVLVLYIEIIMIIMDICTQFVMKETQVHCKLLIFQIYQIALQQFMIQIHYFKSLIIFLLIPMLKLYA